MLQAYFDESGTGPQDKALVLAGLISQPEKWETFARKWKALLDDWGIPFFHMNRFENRQGAYRDWDDDIRETRLNGLLDLICEYSVASVTVAVSEDRFRQVFGTEAQRSLKYALAAITIFYQISKVDRHGNRLFYYDNDADRFAFVFERGAKGIGQVQRVFQRYYNNPLQRMTFRLESINFGEKELPQLQAADILAYELYKHWPRQYESNSRTIRYPHGRLSTIPHSYNNVSVKDMETWKPNLLKAVRERKL